MKAFKGKSFALWDDNGTVVQLSQLFVIFCLEVMQVTEL
jgi:hypothetical protein